MLKDILNLFLDKKSNDIVITNDLKEKLSKELMDYISTEFNVNEIDDVRSATFFALGNADMVNKNIILIIDGEYLPNIYTGITEAWFQRKNVIVIALYKEYDRINCDYLRKCIPNIINVYNNDISKCSEKIKLASTNMFPTLINIKYEDENSKINDYTEICQILNKCLTKSDEVFLYNADIKENNYKFQIKNISTQYKYGTISKYMAYAIAKDKKVVLCCPVEILKLDLNIFNNRYINKNIKIIFYNNENGINNEKFSEWIRENKIKVSKEKNPNDKIIDGFFKSDIAEVLFLGGEQ